MRKAGQIVWTLALVLGACSRKEPSKPETTTPDYMIPATIPADQVKFEPVHQHLKITNSKKHLLVDSDVREYQVSENFLAYRDLGISLSVRILAADSTPILFSNSSVLEFSVSDHFAAYRKSDGTGGLKGVTTSLQELSLLRKISVRGTLAAYLLRDGTATLLNAEGKQVQVSNVADIAVSNHAIAVLKKNGPVDVWPASLEGSSRKISNVLEIQASANWISAMTIVEGIVLLGQDKEINLSSAKSVTLSEHLLAYTNYDNTGAWLDQSGKEVRTFTKLVHLGVSDRFSGYLLNDGSGAILNAQGKEIVDGNFVYLRVTKNFQAYIWKGGSGTLYDTYGKSLMGFNSMPDSKILVSDNFAAVSAGGDVDIWSSKGYRAGLGDASVSIDRDYIAHQGRDNVLEMLNVLGQTELSKKTDGNAFFFLRPPGQIRYRVDGKWIEDNLD